MQWLLSALGHAVGTVVGLFFSIIGFAFSIMARALVQFLVRPLLMHTIFSPLTLGPGTAAGHAAAIVWATGAAVSGAVALAYLLSAIFQRLALSWTGSKSWGELAEGLAVWAAVLVGGWATLNLLLHIANLATQALAAATDRGILHTLSTQWAVSGLAGYAAVVFNDLIWPFGALALAALVIWCVGVWIMRQVDLVLYAGLLPVLAALGVGGHKAPFKWAWSEAMGAVFNQLAMAVVLWIGNLLLAGPAGVHVHLSGGAAVLQQVKDLLLAGTTFLLAARAPQLLANITGHRSAGASHVLTAAALGYLGGRGVLTAARMTRTGQALSRAIEGREQRAQAGATAWAGRPSVGTRLARTGSAVAQALAGTPVGAAAQRATAWAQTSTVGQAV
ncbi:MAG: hypothetical protein OWS74_00990, partial [Firmicutes bacterium]|nr:hypothetical protein [Bacillota bacterium]